MEEVLQLLRSEGFEPTNLQLEELNRFPDSPDDKKNSGWARIFRNYLQSSGVEYYFVIYGSWKWGEPKKWCSLGKRVPASQAQQHKEQLRRAKEEFEKQKQLSYQETAKEVQAFFGKLAATGTSDYLARKGLGAATSLNIGFGSEDGSIYVPCRDADGYLWSCERIYPDGRKWSWAGGRKSGCYHVIGQIADGRRLYLAEGFATAASIHLATGEAAICCFGSGQFDPIGRAIKQRYSKAQLVICGDIGNGAEKAEAAAKALGCPVVFPKFANQDCKLTDFNDLHQAEGLETVRAQLTVELLPVRLAPREVATVPFPDEDEKGKRYGTIENVQEMLRRLGIIVRYNGITKEQEILIPSQSFTVDNRENVSLAHVISWCERCRIPVGNINGALAAIAEKNLYNPVAAWIESRPWDGRSRLKELYATVVAPNSPMKERLMRRWLISAVAAAYQPNGIAAGGMLVFQGPQYIGKTRWFRSLCPEELRADGLELSPSNKDSVNRAITIWLGELGEIGSTFRKSDIDALKAFITSQYDIIRLPYERRKSKYARRTVYFGSVNDVEFLHDATGNRRFWTIACESINPDHSIDMQQLWAEVRELYLAGEQWWLTDEENAELNLSNKQFEAGCPVEELFTTTFGWNAEPTDIEVLPLNATAACMRAGIAHPTRNDINAAGRALRKLSGGRKPDRVKRYLVPVYKSHVTETQRLLAVERPLVARYDLDTV